MKHYGAALTIACLGGMMDAREAAACGGCFAPPTTVQVVTDHRMVLSLSPTQTTLWDQFQYSGSPGEFSWILPIRYSTAVHVDIATNAFMQLADDATAPVVTPPVRPQNPCLFQNGAAAPGGTEAASDAGAVRVDLQEVVGPYAVAIISGTDPMAIRNWLTGNGYVVPPAVSPVIDYYTSLGMDYVALRLRPGEGISQMSPVRITMPGYVPQLPLRMIAAGVADKVGLSLIILAPSRIDAQNFPNGQLTANDLTYDFNHPSNPATDFLNAFERLNTASSGRLWLSESATTQSAASWMARVGGYGTPGGPGTPDAGVGGPDGGPPATPDDDISTAFTPLGSSAVVSRLRADLGVAALNQDLTLEASDLGLLSNRYTYGHVLNTPVFPACTGGDAGVATGVDAGAPVAPGSLTTGGAHCMAAPWARGDRRTGGASLGLLAALGITTVVRRRSRR